MKTGHLFALALLIWGLPAMSFAGAWTLPKGRLWVKTAVFYQSTDTRFCTGQDSQSPTFHEAGCTSPGQSAPFDPFIGGESKALVVYAEATYGITGWLDLGVQVPFYSLGFVNLANPNRPRSKATNVPLLERRELLTVAPGIIYKLKKDLGLEASVRIPISGQDFADGPQFMGAVSYQFNVR